MSYQIRRGDTLSSLAQRYNTSVAALARANKIQDPNVIYSGRSLNIPGSRDEFVSGSGQRSGRSSPAPRTGGSSGTSATGGVGAPSSGSNSAKLEWASSVARKLGLTITSTTGGTHAPGSYHYSGRAIDVAGSPAQMSKFYDAMKRGSPTELFYDPRGGIKNGAQIGAIGGHGDHVHVAF